MKPSTTTRLHVGLATSRLEAAISFYAALLGAEPVKIRPGYAKFEPDDPAVELSLNLSEAPIDTGSVHYGIRVASVEDVDHFAERLAASGYETRREDSVECCYATQTKVWADDPDGHPWEVYVVLDADAERRTSKGSICCESKGCCE
ncbi:MAG: ArsI/CadI family heavy metal resistance metalloenzyme [Planctomycetota bacterium]